MGMRIVVLFTIVSALLLRQQLDLDALKDVGSTLRARDDESHRHNTNHPHHALDTAWKREDELRKLEHERLIREAKGHEQHHEEPWVNNENVDTTAHNSAVFPPRVHSVDKNHLNKIDDDIRKNNKDNLKKKVSSPPRKHVLVHSEVINNSGEDKIANGDKNHKKSSTRSSSSSLNGTNNQGENDADDDEGGDDGADGKHRQNKKSSSPQVSNPGDKKSLRGDENGRKRDNATSLKVEKHRALKEHAIEEAKVLQKESMASDEVFDKVLKHAGMRELKAAKLDTSHDAVPPLSNQQTTHVSVDPTGATPGPNPPQPAGAATSTDADPDASAPGATSVPAASAAPDGNSSANDDAEEQGDDAGGEGNDGDEDTEHSDTDTTNAGNDADGGGNDEEEDAEHSDTDTTNAGAHKRIEQEIGNLRNDVLLVKKAVEDLTEDIDDGVKIEKEHPEPWIEPISTTMLCIINLCLQYFAIFTAAAVIRSFNNIMGVQHGSAEKVVAIACDTVTYAPMLCVLFLGARMRALQVTQGEGDPQDYARYAMQSCTWALLFQTVLVLVIPVLTGEVVETDEDGNALPLKASAKENACAGIITILRYSAMVMLYAGFTTVCVAIPLMNAETLETRNRKLWDDPDTSELELAPPVSPAISATMNLTIQFFAVYLALACIRSLVSFTPESNLLKRWLKTFQVAKATVDMAPMLCILFIGARMRALEMDPINGEPQPWAQSCFHLCAYAIFAQTIMVIILPLVGRNAAPPSDKRQGDIDMSMPMDPMTIVIHGIRYLALLASYCGLTVVIVSIVLIKAPDDAATPELSTAMSCVMNLTIQYFIVQMLLFVSQFLTILKKIRDEITDTLLAAKGTVIFCPMLAVLFVGTRMRALQLTDNQGSPQCWAQEAMTVCTYAVMVQLIMALILGIFVGPPMMDKDGNPEININFIKSHFMRLALETFKWVTMVCLYGGAITICVSILFIKKDTAFCGHPPVPRSVS